MTLSATCPILTLEELQRKKTLWLTFYVAYGRISGMRGWLWELCCSSCWMQWQVKLTISEACPTEEMSLRSAVSWIRASLERKSAFCCKAWLREFRRLATMLPVAADELMEFPQFKRNVLSDSNAVFSRSRSVASVYNASFKLPWTVNINWKLYNKENYTVFFFYF
jgi:hypothetical protein